MIRSENLRSGYIQDDVEEYLYRLLPERDAVIGAIEKYAEEHRVPIIGPAVARLMMVESVGLNASVDEVRHQLQERFAHMVAEEVRLALLDDEFYANQDPQVFGRSVVGAVNDAVGYFLTHRGADAESLAASLCRIFAP